MIVLNLGNPNLRSANNAAMFLSVLCTLVATKREPRKKRFIEISEKEHIKGQVEGTGGEGQGKEDTISHLVTDHGSKSILTCNTIFL